MLEASKAIDKASGYIMSQDQRDSTSPFMSMVYSTDYQYVKLVQKLEEVSNDIFCPQEHVNQRKINKT